MRILPLAAGIAELSLFLVIKHPPGTASQVAVYLPGISCAELARTPALGSCPAGAKVAGYLPLLAVAQSQAGQVWPAATIASARLPRLPVLSVAVATNGSAAAVDRVRTVFKAAYPLAGPTFTVGQNYGPNARLIVEYQQLAEVVIVASLVIAGCALAGSVIAGLNERKRPFSLLRLTGAPLPMLRRVIAIESAVPLLAVAVASGGAGFLAAELFLRVQLHESLQPPGAGYVAIVATGLALSLGLIAATFPILNRITGPETARNE